MTVANPSNYWISSNALRITLNANGDADYIQGNTASGAMILCYIKNVDGLGYDAGHNYQRWKLLLSPTFFPTKTAKYVYVAIPRADKKVQQDYAQVVFPSELLDIYGKNASEQQIGTTDYYYIWLQGIISASEVGGVLQDRVWTEYVQTGTLASDEAYDAGGDNTWWRYSSVDDIVTFLKGIVMDAHSWFENIRLGRDKKNIVGVANDTTEETNDDRLVTPKQVIRLTKAHYLNSDEEDIAQEQIGFLKGLWIKTKGLFGFDEDGNAKVNDFNAAGDADILGDLGVNGDATIDGILHVLAKIVANQIESDNFNGDGPFDTGFELTKGADGITSLVIDKLFVRMKAIFNELEIRKISYSGGNIIFSHAGSKVVYVTEIYEGGYEYQENIIVVDEGYHEHRGIFGVNGEYNKETRGITLIGAHLEPNPVPRPSDDKIVAYRCYLLADDGSTATENWWRVDDQARWETFNIKEGTYQNVANTFGWRKVIATGTSPLHDGKMYDYIDLSRTDCASGSDIPKVGDELVQMGNRTDAERQGFVTIEVAGDYAPAFKVYKGVNGYTLDGKRKVCISPKLTDIKAQRFVIETEYDAARVPFQRSEPWYDGMHCYYYDLVQHKGASWLCTFPEEGHEGVMYTTEEPSETATYWRIYAQKGEKGDSVSYDEEHSSIGYAYSSMGTPESGREYPSDITSWSSTPPAVQKGKYLWTKDVTAYDNAGTIVYTTTYGVQYQPNDGESVEIDSSRTFVKYCKQSASQYTGQIPADSDFSTQYPSSFAQGDYLWILNQVAYIGVATPLKSYSLSRLGVDGDDGDPGADGYSTHFAYATSADGSQNFSTTNYDGATYIGTYRDKLPNDSQNYRDYVWTAWKGADGKNSASLYLDQTNVLVQVDADNKIVVESGNSLVVEVPFYVIAAEQALAHYSAQISEGGTTHYATLGGVGVWDVSGENFTREGTGVSIEDAHIDGRGIILPGGVTFAPSTVILTFPKNGVLDEHKVNLTVVALDNSGNEYTVFGAIEIKHRKDGEDGDPGDDAVNVIVTPASLIVNQSLETPSNLSSLSEQIMFAVTQGETQKTVTKVDNIVVERDNNRNKCNVSGSNSNYATLTSIGTDADNHYYDQAYFTCRVWYDSNTKHIDNIKVKVYANLLGTWKETVEADTKSAIAESTWFDLDEHGNIVESQRLGNFVQSSKENTAKLEELNYIAISHGTTNQFTLTADHITQYGSTYRLVMDYQCSFETVTITIRKGAETIAVFTNVMSYDTFDEELTELTAGTYAIAFDKAVTLDRVDLFAVGADKFSEISQTVDNINLEIRNGLESTGIYIENGLIKATTNNFKICNSSGTETFSVDSNGNLVAAGNAKFNGNIETAGGTIGGFSIGQHLIKSGNDKIILNDDGTATIGSMTVDSDGKITATSVDMSGKITATDGAIGGFSIGTKDLTNTAYDASIVIQNAANNPTQIARIGKSAVDAMTSQPCSLQAESTKHGTYNTALYLKASGATYDYAFHGEGNGVLNGLVFGFKTQYVSIPSGTSDSLGYINLQSGATIALKGSHSDGHVVMAAPNIDDVRQCLGLSTSDTTTPFAIEITVINISSYEHVHVGFRSDTASGTTLGTKYPWLMNYNNIPWPSKTRIQVAQGD